MHKSPNINWISLGLVAFAFSFGASIVGTAKFGERTATTNTAAISEALVVGEEDILVEDDATPATHIHPKLDTAAIYRSQSVGAMVQAIATKSAASSGLWSNPATWGGALPTANDSVEIPDGVTVTIDTNAQAGSVEVNGVLKAGAVDASLTTRWVMVMGAGSRFEVGTPAVPFQKSFVLELTGTDTGENIHSAGTKFLMAMDGGEVTMHGVPQVSWTRLAATASVGAAQITLAQPVAWNIGDQIVIASSNLSPIPEVRTIKARSADGKTLTLTQPLTNRHMGAAKSYTRPTDNKTWVLNERAEVGLLTHNVKIQGDATSDATKFGAHVMIMKGGKGYFSSVQLFRMGQKQKLGRYPIHWHLLENTATGQYIRNSSIYRSYNRAVTLHGTEGVSIERNVAYDHVGHGIFLEDGVEQFNKIDYNLVLLTKRPAPGEELLPSDNERDEFQNRTPASFWITNPNNEFIGNAAAGTVGTGFWFALPSAPLGLSASLSRYRGLNPQKQALGVFRGNFAHSVMNGIDIHDSIDPATQAIVLNVNWTPPTTAYLEGFTTYADDQGVYGGGVQNLLENIIFRDLISADNVLHIRLAHTDVVENSLFVADSGNLILPATTPRSFYALYDGPGRIRNSRVVGFNVPRTSLIFNGSASVKRPAPFSGITTDSTTRPRIVFSDYTKVVPPESVQAGSFLQAVVQDIDGSLTGAAGRSIISNHPILRTSTDTLWPNGTNAYISQQKFTFLHLNFVEYVPEGQAPGVTVTRTGGGQATTTFTDRYPKTFPSKRLNTIVNKGFTYTISFDRPSSLRVEHDGAQPGDTVLLRFTPIGDQAAVPPINQQGWQKYTTLENLKSAPGDGYFVDAQNALWLKFVNVTQRQDVIINYTAILHDLPAAPTNPSPPDLSTNVPLARSISWQDGGGATSYNVYFGTSPAALPYKGTQTKTFYPVSNLSSTTAYYWRIDAVNTAGATAGPVWKFTTLPTIYAGTAYLFSTGFSATQGANNWYYQYKMATSSADMAWDAT